MPARSRALRALAVSAVALLLPTLLLAPASGAKPAPVVYDALGDSYASGAGVPPYSACGRSEAAYPVQLDGRKHIALDEFVACAGATTATLVSGGQLEALDAETRLVTLTIGGNDIGWSTAVGACLTKSDAVCSIALQASLTTVSTVLPARLQSVYGEVATRAPDASVLVVGYPRLFSPEYGAYLGASPAEQQALNDGADTLNGVIEQAATAAGFTFVDVTQRFVDHGVNAPEPWLTGALDPTPFHPNALGYDAYTGAVTSAATPALLR
jgi:lysophospholipase L1-like esterase